MASKTASRLKADWMEMPGECFEPLTFGELKVGQKFIGLPYPGDNSGHGGFRSAYYIFTKTHQKITKTESGLPYGIPHGRARDDKRGILTDCPDCMLIILVE